MEERRFDDFTKAMARSVGRRPLLKGLIAAAFGAAVPLVGAEAAAASGGGNSACDTWCDANFTGRAAGACISAAAMHKGPCYQCGPASPNHGQGQAVCNGHCTDITTTANCGGCGNTCTAPAGETATCVNGQCGVTCGPGMCSIGGACYTAGADNPANACQLCDPTQSTTDWSQHNCNDDNACTVDSCDPVLGCISTPLSCDDGNPCTIDSCDPTTGCIHTEIDCDDGDACTTDTCDPTTGQCVHENISCDDGIDCTIDSCDTTTGCIHIPDDSLCSSPDLCLVATCDVVQGCVLTPVDCDDNNLCTVDACDSGTGQCIHTPITCPTGECCDPSTGMCSVSACT